MLEKLKQAGDSGQIFGVLLADLSKAFDCPSHVLLVTKLNTYGLKLVHEYLSNSNQRTKVNRIGSWWEIVFIVPQGLNHYCLASFLQICFSF